MAFPITVTRIKTTSPADQIKKTMFLIGKAIRDGSHYWPIHAYAASQARKAPPKDYFGQVKAIYDQLTQRDWKYVKDPAGLEMIPISPKAIYQIVLGQNGGIDGKGGGAEDCDGAAAVAMGALLRSINVPVIITTIASPGSHGRSFNHVFVIANIQGRGWTPVDPVGYPKHPMGWIGPHSRIAYWDLNGKLLKELNYRRPRPGRAHRAQF